MKYNYIKRKYVEKIETLTLKHVFHLKIKAFTFVEILFALSVTLLCLSLTPNIINLTSYYLHLAKNNDDLDFEFFVEIFLKMYKLPSIRQVKIMIQQSKLEKRMRKLDISIIIKNI